MMNGTLDETLPSASRTSPHRSVRGGGGVMTRVLSSTASIVSIFENRIWPSPSTLPQRLQRHDGILGGHRGAIVEHEPFPQRDRIGQPILGDRGAFGHLRLDNVILIHRKQRVVHEVRGIPDREVRFVAMGSSVFTSPFRRRRNTSSAATCGEGYEECRRGQDARRKAVIRRCMVVPPFDAPNRLSIPRAAPPTCTFWCGTIHVRNVYAMLDPHRASLASALVLPEKTREYYVRRPLRIIGLCLLPLAHLGWTRNDLRHGFRLTTIKDGFAAPSRGLSANHWYRQRSTAGRPGQPRR